MIPAQMLACAMTQPVEASASASVMAISNHSESEPPGPPASAGTMILNAPARLSFSAKSGASLRFASNSRDRAFASAARSGSPGKRSRTRLELCADIVILVSGSRLRRRKVDEVRSQAATTAAISLVGAEVLIVFVKPPVGNERPSTFPLLKRVGAACKLIQGNPVTARVCASGNAKLS